jgi:hypothetical protein
MTYNEKSTIIGALEYQVDRHRKYLEEQGEYPDGKKLASGTPLLSQTENMDHLYKVLKTVNKLKATY